MADRTAATIALVYPDLLGTYGDAGNATVLAARLRWRGIEAEVLTVGSGQPVAESCDVYVLGGGEDLPQVLAAQMLAKTKALHRAVQKGAVVLAVCAGLQILGESFPAPGDDAGAKRQNDGLGLLPCVTRRAAQPSSATRRARSAPARPPGHGLGGELWSAARRASFGALGRPRGARSLAQGRRAIGEVLVRPQGRWGNIGLLTGFENHASATELLPGAEPAGTVLAGVGNQDGTYEGVVSGRIWGTYLHGPVLARNPRLADLLLTWAVGELAPLDDSEPAALHAERASRGPSERRLLERKLQ